MTQDEEGQIEIQKTNVSNLGFLEYLTIFITIIWLYLRILRKVWTTYWFKSWSCPKRELTSRGESKQLSRIIISILKILPKRSLEHLLDKNDPLNKLCSFSKNMEKRARKIREVSVTSIIIKTKITIWLLVS